MNDYEPKQPLTIEQTLSPETQELVTTFTELRTRLNITNPDDLPEDDDDVVDALEDQGEWTVLVDGEASRIGTQEAAEEANFLKSAFFVTAGFTDETYLIEVLDWIDQDEQRASQMGLDGLASRIRSKMQEITDILDQV